MAWFSKICRNLGLMVHNIKNPEDKNKQVLRKETETWKQGEMTLRRTTIEEIEYSPQEQNEHSEDERSRDT